MRKLIVVLAGLITLCSCSFETVILPPEYSNSEPEFYDYRDGETIVTDDECFLIDVYPIKIIQEGEDRYIAYEFSVENNQKKEYKNFQITLEFNQDLDIILAAGAIPYPYNKFFLTYLDSESDVEGMAIGMDVSAHRLLRTDDFLDEWGLKFEDVYEYGKEYIIHLTWDGGGKNVVVTAPVINEIGNL